MPITVIVRAAAGAETRLTFDGTQRVVLGRGAGCDVRLPEPSVSHRHASLRAHGADFVLVDEGSANGTFVGGVRIAPRTSRIVRSGDLVRAGRVWLELRIDQSPVTRDVAAATRELALAFVADAMAAMGADATLRVCVVEGRDQGAVLPLAEEDRTYTVGRASECDLALSDADVSREHVHIVRRGNVVVARDLGAKNGTWLGEARIPKGTESVWRPAHMMQVGRTVLALVEPLHDALAAIENAPDRELIPEALVAATPTFPGPTSIESPAAGAAATRTELSGNPAPLAAELPKPRRKTGARRAMWSVTDYVVMAAAVAVLMLSLAGLVWLLRR